MKTTKDFTLAAWVAEFEKATAKRPEGDEGLTVKELMELWHAGDKRVRAVLRNLHAEGRLILGRRPLPPVTGIDNVTYRSYTKVYSVKVGK